MICRPYDRGKGRFSLDQTVTWKASKKGKVHKGVIVEVVKYGMYPSVTRPPDQYPVITWPELCTSHYCRDHESYVIEDETGRRWWPRVGNLILVEKYDGN